MKAINTKEMCETLKSLRSAKIRLNLHTGDKHLLSDDIDAIQDRKAIETLTSQFNTETEKLSEAIKEAQGRSSARTITAEQIVECLISLDRKLDIAKKDKEGIKIVVDLNAQNFPSAYKYTPESTFFNAEYKSGSWRITDIYRNRTARAGHGTEIALTPAAETALLAKYRQF